jgi:monoamine oxidase
MDKQSVINTYEKNEDIFSIKHKYDVVIIGSGVAGCEAARKLYDNGIKNILILEARDRLGGNFFLLIFLVFFNFLRLLTI